MIYECGYEAVQVQHRDIPKCLKDFSIEKRKENKILSAVNQMLIDNSAE